MSLYVSLLEEYQKAPLIMSLGISLFRYMWSTNKPQFHICNRHEQSQLCIL